MLSKRFLFATIFFLIITATIAGSSLYFKKQPPALAQAMSIYYVDPDWIGVESGTASQPWSVLNTSAWAIINSSLANNDVAVYFSAREAGIDIDEVSTSAIQLNRIDGSAHRLTLDGMSKYNTDDIAPSWLDYAGSAKHEIQNSVNASITTANPTNIKRYYITIRGFFTNPANNQCIYLKQFNNGIVEFNKCTHQLGATSGPGIILTYDKLDPDNTRSQSVIIRNNIIQDNYGEGIYISGCKEEITCSAAMDDILIENNTIIDPGSRGGEGDGIDIKNFNTNVVVKNNTIYYTVDAGDVGCIVSHSIAIIDRNFIYNCGSVGIRISEWDPYDHKDIAMDGGEIRSNIIIGGNMPVGSQYGIRIISFSGGYDYRNIKVSNNTITGFAQPNSVGIYIYENDIAANMTGIDVQNNAVSMINGLEFSATAGTLGFHNYNNYYDILGNVYAYGTVNIAYDGNMATQETNSLITDPLFINTNIPYSANNFSIQSNSPIKDVGTILLGFFTDYAGISRPQGSAWDIGAYEYVTSLKGDFNSDSKVNDADFLSLKNVFKNIVSALNSIFDLNSDSTIDVKDLGVLMSGWLP